jgi:AraC family transcriptional regulator
MQSAPTSSVTAGTSAGLEELLREARSSLIDTPADAERCIDRALRLLSDKVRGDRGADQPSAQIRGGLAPWQIRRLNALVESHLAETLRCTDLAAAVRLSISHFTRMFAYSFGVPPHAYIVERRIAHAKYLIETADTPLCEIALACGFANQSHLSRAFRRVAGQTPNSWRRNAISGRPLGTDSRLARLGSSRVTEAEMAWEHRASDAGV